MLSDGVATVGQSLGRGFECNRLFSSIESRRSSELLRRLRVMYDKAQMATNPSTLFFGVGKTRAEALRQMSPHLVADVYLYPTAEGGKNLTVQPGWGCPCSCSKSSDAGFYDGWPLLDAPFAPGERRRLGFVFIHGDDISSEDIAAILRRAGTFYLWEGHFIGEAAVVP